MCLLRSLDYCLFVSLSVHVIGRGWPGSLAGSVISVAVPSFTYEFSIIPCWSSESRPGRRPECGAAASVT